MYLYIIYIYIYRKQIQTVSPNGSNHSFSQKVSYLLYRPICKFDIICSVAIKSHFDVKTKKKSLKKMK